MSIVHRIPLGLRHRLFALAFPRGKTVEINGDRFRLHAEHRRFGNHERETWQRFAAEIREGDVVADVGANIGAYALAAARRVGESGRVVAFEPDPRAARRLGLHARLNGLQSRIQIVAACAGAEPGETRFAFHGRSYWSSAVSLGEREGTTYGTVPVVALDDVLPRADILKIDVEGMEGRVLAGARRLLADPARRPRLAIVEVHPEPLAAVGESWEELRAALPGWSWERIPGDDEEWLGRPLP